MQDAVWMEHKDFIKEQGMVLLEWTTARRAGPTVCACVVYYALFLLKGATAIYEMSSSHTARRACPLYRVSVVMVLLRSNGMREGG